MITAAAGPSSARGDSGALLDAFLARLLAVLVGSTDSLPLFDRDVGQLAHALTDVLAHLGVPVRRISAEPVLAKGLIESLPSFSDAPMDEVLDARRALSPTLARFRAAIARFSDRLQLDTLAQPAQSEIALLYRQEVAPALEELHEMQKDLRLGHQLARHSVISGRDITKPVLGLVLASAIDVDAIVRALLALTPTAADIAGRVIGERHEIGARRRENQFLFLYEADRRLQ